MGRIYRKITHVIYDMDGLLLNTEPFYTKANQEIAARYGRTFDWSHKSRVIGLRAMDTARILVKTIPLPITPEEYLELRKHLLEDLFPQAQPMPGAVRLTEHLHRYGVAQAVASSSDRHHFELKTSRHKKWLEIFQCFVVGADPDVKHGKPAPDVFLVAAQRLGAEPANCLVFEDAPSGVEAACAAGMAAIAVPDPNLGNRAFPCAAQILRSLTEFDPADWGLPAYQESP
ncbi:MAG TPA: HAD-IA family hydrolase [Acidobacteriota bacterium]|nr:HAD-IA family hydrolase [Acidobacteriota bacterium]